MKKILSVVVVVAIALTFVFIGVSQSDANEFIALPKAVTGETAVMIVQKAAEATGLHYRLSTNYNHQTLLAVGLNPNFYLPSREPLATVESVEVSVALGKLSIFDIALGYTNRVELMVDPKKRYSLIRISIVGGGLDRKAKERYKEFIGNIRRVAAEL